MPHRNQRQNDEDQVLDDAVPADGVPSHVAQSRLSLALRDRAEAYRQEATADLTIVDALLRVDEAEAAARQIDDHRASLHAMARDLQVVVADAAVEREAERVYEACAAAITPPSEPRSVLRRRVLAVTGAAAVALALVLPSGRMSPRATLANLVDRRTAFDDITAARERLQAAREWARVLRQDTAPQSPRRSNALVRDKVRSILAADATGGSAALSLGGVSSLDAQRAKRRPSGETETGKPRTLAPVVPLKPPNPPRSAEPLKSDLPVDDDDVRSFDKRTVDPAKVSDPSDS